jgi:hypothetical protein
VAGAVVAGEVAVLAVEVVVDSAVSAVAADSAVAVAGRAGDGNLEQ